MLQKLGTQQEAAMPGVKRGDGAGVKDWQDVATGVRVAGLSRVGDEILQHE